MLGTSLLHYNIVEKLGEGGMGVVYKAQDTHLDRFVALKVLPHDRVANEERKRRFIQEAKAASALNHPNIVTIYDIATDRDVTFIAMEFIPGKALSDAIPRQGLPLPQLLNYAAQIADGLAKAHQAGIIHRDLKPGNIMIGDDGRVRILDFGLAKLTDPGVGSEDDATHTMANNPAPKTDEGIVLGTVAYMSPEQAEGRKVDTRTDIFSFGVVLYEMITGRKPFTGQTRLATMSAILKESHKPLSEVAPSVPPDLERLVDRCLRKDPDRRWQNMPDVRISLLEMHEDSASGKLAAAPASAGVRSGLGRLWIYAAAVLVLVALVVGWALLRKPAQQAAKDLVPIPLTVFPGDQRDPAFSPDGNQVAFSWGPEGGVTNEYVKVVGAGDLVRLTNTPGEDRMAQWSPDGKWIEFFRNVNGKATIVAIPALGGPERTISPTRFHASWTPDSQWIVVGDGGTLYLAPLQGGERKVLLEGKYQCGAGSISPDGHTLAAACRTAAGSPLYVVPLSDGYVVKGTPRMVAPEDWNVPSWSWTPDSKELVFIRSIGNANLGGDSFMYRVAIDGGTPQRIEYTGNNPWYLDVARRGDRLAYTRLKRDINVYRAELEPDGTLKKPGERIASSSRTEMDAQYSPDGSRIVFTSNRSGPDEIWVAGSDGKNLVQLTSSTAPVGTSSPRWSPDGTMIAYTSRAADQSATDIFVISSSGGAPRRITDDPAADLSPYWSLDGKWIYFASNRGGATGLWKVAVAGGTDTQVSTRVGSAGAESPDGKWRYQVWSDVVTRVPLAAGPKDGVAAQVLVRDRIAANAAAITARGVYYLSPAQDLQSSTLRLLPLDGGEPKTLGTIPHTTEAGLSVSPDFKSILYSQCDQCAADLMLVENFH
ncbi:MAG: protein kinase [Acidobacteriia bacterium]|nr:protein kinase [Terriglobia bacterium]